MINRIHHINFLVRDLGKAISRYQDLLGVVISQRDELPDRGVKIARVRLGETWIVLVQPIDSDGIPAQHLARHGEGFFLISYQVEDVRAATANAAAAGAVVEQTEPRRALDDWLVMDLSADDLFGVCSQFVQSAH